jgi:probable HAF family extracellular repeat protein
VKSILLPFRRKGILYLVSAISLVAAGLVTPRQIRGQTNAYIVTELSADDATQIPCKLNNLGDLVGRARSSGEAEPRATVWNHSKLVKKHLGAFTNGDYSSASDINDAGEVAGVSNTEKGMVPFIWTARDRLQRIPLLPGDSCGQAISINKYGHVVGYSSGQNGAKAFLWARGGGVRSLGTLPGGESSKARDLNDADEVVGRSSSVAGVRAVLWTKTGNVRDLGTLPGDWASEAIAINNNGEVVGYSKGPRGMRAFLWNKTDGMQDLGVLPGADSSRALDINDFGAVVGSSATASGDHAFIWTRQAGMTDLNSTASADLGILLIEATAINSKGAIIALGGNAHEGGMGGVPGSGDKQICAPAPPSTFLLTPTTAP